MRTAIFSARFDQLNAIREFVGSAARDAGMGDSDIYAVELSMDEACTNIIEHAYAGVDGGQIECTCSADHQKLTIIVHDHGSSFDPATVALPDLDAALDSRPVGGLGIFLMNKLMDEVHYESLGEAGNVLTLIKNYKSAGERTRLRDRLSNWQRLFLLGEELLKAGSLVAQRDLILEFATHLLQCKAELWLDEKLLRLQGSVGMGLFPLQPPAGSMQNVFFAGKEAATERQETLLTTPFKSDGLVMGVLQVSRPQKPFSKKEIELLEGLASHISLALVASHRIAVEQWRIEQLTLVRRVSAQIANVVDLVELTRRVTRLIQRTFHYYYVAIFTIETGRETLRFRSSAGPEPGRGRWVKVRLGEGLIGSVAQSGEEVVALDVTSDERFKFIAALPETHSEAALPLKIEDRILGVLDVQSNQVDGFHPNDLMVLRALADTIAIALNGARLYSEVKLQLERLSVVAQVSRGINSSLDLAELLQTVVDLIQKNLKFPYVHLYSVHFNRKQITFEAGSGAHSESLKGTKLDLDKDPGVIAWVARSKQIRLENNLPRQTSNPGFQAPGEDTRSEMTLPLIFNDSVIGVLDLQSNRINAFREEDRLLCSALADNIAAAIHNADLYSTERWRRQVADSLREVAGLISSEAGLDDVLNRVLRELERNLPCDVSAIWLMEGGRLYLAQVHGGDMLEIDRASRRWPETYEFLVSALESEQPIVRNPDDPIGPSGTAMGYAADYSSIAAGLRAGDRPLGVLTLSHHTSGRYGHEAQAIIATFASHAAVAIENARLYDLAQEQAYASAALLQVAQTVANSNNLEETIGGIVRITPLLVGVKACALFLLEGQTFHSTQSYGFSEEAEAAIQKDFKPGDFPLLDAVGESGKMAVGIPPSGVKDEWLNLELARDEEETLLALQNGDRLMIGFPLMVRNDLFGVFFVEDVAEDIRFRPKRVEIIHSIAQQMALNIQNDRLQREMVMNERLEHEIQLARQIQQTFLPEHLPEVPGWNLAATWITAQQVGGDFYDVIELPCNTFGLFIADVSEKGMPAALFMALTRTLVRAIVTDCSSPAEVLKRVNALILPNNQQGMFVTAVYGVLNLESGEFTYANAGHNPPILMHRGDRSLEILGRSGAALGILEDLTMDERTIHLEAEDFLLLYTDGLTEAFSPGDEMYGVDRLFQSLRSSRASTSRGLLDHLESSVRKFMGTLPPADDLTMLGIRREKGHHPPISRSGSA